MEIKITEAQLSNIQDIRKVQFITWLKTYPNKEIGITQEDIKIRFSELENSFEEKMKKYFSNENVKFLVAKEGDILVGFCRLQKYEDKNQLNAIYVLPEYQGKGIGKLFWEEIQKYIDKSKDIIVEVATYNEKAIEFYKKLGFVDTGKRFSDERFRMKSGSIIPEMEMVIRAKNKSL